MTPIRDVKQPKLALSLLSYHGTVAAINAQPLHRCECLDLGRQAQC